MLPGISCGPLLRASASAPVGTPVLIASVDCDTSVSTKTATTSTGIVAGDTVAVCIGGFDSTVTVTSVTDGTNTYTKLFGGVSAGTNGGFELWYTKNATAVSSGATITANSSGATFLGFVAARIPGANATSPFDVTNSNSTFTMTPSVASGTLGAANEVVLGCFGGYNVTGWTEDAAFTTLAAKTPAASQVAVVMAYKKVTATSSVTYAPTFTGSLGKLLIGVATLKA